MIADDDETLVFVFGIPILQGGHHMLAIDTRSGRDEAEEDAKTVL
jgi:hypothetical protein